MRLAVWGAVLILSLAAGTAAGAPAYTLDLAATPLQEVPMVVAAPATIHFKIIRTGDAADSATLDLTDFTNEQGVVLPVRCSIAGPGGGDCAHLGGQALQAPVVPVDLQVPAFPTGGKFGGRLILTATATGAGGVPAVFAWRFILSSAADVRPAMLRAEPASATALQAVRGWCVPWTHWCGGDTPVASVHIYDKTMTWPLTGVFAGFEGGQAVTGPGLDPVAHITATFNGSPAPGIFGAAGVTKYDVARGSAALVGFTFNNLAPGAYSFPIRFAAANSAVGDDQAVTFTLQLRNTWLSAIPVLLLGALVSFLATRIVVMLQRRASFLQRLHTMRPSWLADEPPILPVIGLRASLKQAQDLSNRFWVTGQAELNSRLDAAALLLGVLDRVRQVRARMHINTPQIQQRAEWKLRAIVHDIGAGPLSTQDAANLNSQLDDLARWGDPAQQAACYWTDLKGFIAAKCAVVRAEAMPTAAQDEVERLLKLLRADLAATDTDIDAKIKAEDDYGRLAILWEVRANEDLVDKVLHTADQDMDALHKIVDDHWWQLLKTKHAEIQIMAPQSDIEAYDIVTLQVRATEDADLRDSYLVHQKICWHWTITTTVGGIPRTRELVSMEPQIAQYARLPGTMSASVRMTYNGAELQRVKQHGAINIRPSEDFRSWRFFEMSDLISTVLAMVVSVGSGIALYAFAPTFGSVKDYFALLTWAAGLDQGKNFLQSLAVYATPTKPAS